MQTQQFFDSANLSGKAAFETFKEVGEINRKTFEKLYQKQVELVSRSVDNGVRQLKALSEAKSYEDLLAEQARMAEETGQQLINHARDVVATVRDAREAYSALVEKGVNDASEQVRKAGKKASA